MLWQQSQLARRLSVTRGDAQATTTGIEWDADDADGADGADGAGGAGGAGLDDVDLSLPPVMGDPDAIIKQGKNCIALCRITDNTTLRLHHYFNASPLL